MIVDGIICSKQYFMKKQEHTRSSTGSGSDHYVRITESMKKKFCLKQSIFTVYHITRLALSLTIIILISQTSLKPIKQTQPYLRIQQILQLWSKNMIVDMITVSTYNCPKGYEPYTSAQWEGTKEGCLCVTSINQYEYVHVLPGDCTMKLVDVGCTRIGPQRAIPFVFWRVEKLICVRRIAGLNFYTNLSSSPNFNKKQLKTCSKGSPHEIQSLAPEKCPITEISPSSSALPFSLPDINFSFTSESSYPIIDIKMTEYSFCQEYNRANISPNRFENYDLQQVEISNCAEDGDPRVREIDWITQRQLFQSNRRIYDVITNQLPAYPRPTNRYIYKLGTVEYPAWTHSCRQSEQFSLQRAKSTFEFTQAIEKTETCLALTIVMIILWGFVYSLISITRRIIQIHSRHKNGILFYPQPLILHLRPNLLNKLKPSLFCESMLFLFLLGIALALLIQIGVQYQYISGVEEWLRNSFGCMDEAGYFRGWVMDGYVVGLQNNVRSYLVCLLAAVVGVGVDIVYLIWRLNRGDLASEKISNLFTSDIEEKNSDERIEPKPDDIPNEKQGDVINMDEQNNREKDYVIDEEDNEHYENAFKERHRTRDIDIEGLDVEDSPREGDLVMSRRFRSSKGQPRSNLRNTQGRTRAINEIHNQTEQSLVANDNIDDQDLQFHNIILDNPTRHQKPPKNKKRLQSFDLNE